MTAGTEGYIDLGSAVQGIDPSQLVWEAQSDLMFEDDDLDVEPTMFEESVNLVFICAVCVRH